MQQLLSRKDFSLIRHNGPYRLLATASFGLQPTNVPREAGLIRPVSVGCPTSPLASNKEEKTLKKCQ